MPLVQCPLSLSLYLVHSYCITAEHQAALLHGKKKKSASAVALITHS